MHSRYCNNLSTATRSTKEAGRTQHQCLRKWGSGKWTKTWSKSFHSQPSKANATKSWSAPASQNFRTKIMKRSLTTTLWSKSLTQWSHRHTPRKTTSMNHRLTIRACCRWTRPSKNSIRKRIEPPWSNHSCQTSHSTNQARTAQSPIWNFRCKRSHHELASTRKRARSGCATRVYRSLSFPKATKSCPSCRHQYQRSSWNSTWSRRTCLEWQTARCRRLNRRRSLSIHVLARPTTIDQASTIADYRINNTNK